ncbi:hypothetical protein BD309DRAFT_975658 [Dichomitus squalens]|nr:hypothetical protein BD309DRAFT_975658 [Dichomitus squalens]
MHKLKRTPRRPTRIRPLRSSNPWRLRWSTRLCSHTATVLLLRIRIRVTSVVGLFELQPESMLILISMGDVHRYL